MEGSRARAVDDGRRPQCSIPSWACAVREDETDLFFGRDGQSDELTARLARRRFVAVVGASGSGKSSLVRAGLFATLNGGLMAGASSSWRIALLRPGNAPIASLASALHRALRDPAHPDDDVLPAAVIEATLRRSSLGLIEAVQQARMPADDNVLVVVDQFEELFRFKRATRDAHAEADAVRLRQAPDRGSRQTRADLRDADDAIRFPRAIARSSAGCPKR